MNSVNLFANNVHFSSQIKKPEMKSILKDAQQPDFIKGFTVGAAMAAAVIGVGVNSYNKHESKELMKDMMEEYRQDDTKSLKIEDLNNDKSPEIIIEKEDGVQCVYDVKHNNVHFKIDDEMIEKIR